MKRSTRKAEVTKILDSLNNHFAEGHQITKEDRSLESLYNMLLYKSSCYKESINQIQEMFSSRREKFVIDHKKFDLVAIAIAVKGEKFGCFGTSHNYLKNDKFEKKLKIRLRLVLGEIGKPSLKTNSKNIIGKCAEVKAANNILKLEKKLEIDNLLFTNAIRPRTLEVRSRCINCVEVFGNEK